MLGPVFHAEMLTTARRRRYYVARFIYGVILLLVVAFRYASSFSLIGGGQFLSIRRLTDFARDTFISFAIAQGIAIVFLTPVLVAGVIADEKQRKTLHYLLASQLTSREIIWGKLFARAFHVGIFLAMGLPVISLLSLFGGLEPGEVVLAYAATATTAFFIAGIAMLASTYALRPRGAILGTYLMLLFWSLAPFIVMLSMTVMAASQIWPRPPINEVMTAMEWLYPMVGPLDLMRLPFGTPLIDRVAWLMVLEVVYGVLFILAAQWRLRPVARSQEGKPRWEIRLDNRGRRRWQLRLRPSVGRDAMLWKEMHTSRVGGVLRLLGMLASLSLIVLIGCMTYESARFAFKGMNFKDFRAASEGTGQREFNELLRGLTGLLYTLWLIGTAVTAATGVSGEREGDTWTSLIATELTGWEIIRSKLVGAVWRFRVIGLVLIVLWGIGLASASLHPIGAVAVLIEFLAFLAFASALGTYVSMRSTTTLRALVVTVGILLTINGGHLLLTSPFGTWAHYVSSFAVTPWLVGDSLLSYRGAGLFLDPNDPYAWPGMPQLFGRYPSYDILHWPDWLALNFGVVGLMVLIYLAATAILVIRSIAIFDRVADRPRSPGVWITANGRPVDPAGGVA